MSLTKCIHCPKRHRIQTWDDGRKVYWCRDIKVWFGL